MKRFSKLLTSCSAMAAAPMVTTMPVKFDGKVIPAGALLPDMDKETRLSLKDYLRPADDGEVGEDVIPDLGDALQNLIAQGVQLKGMNMTKTKALLGAGFNKVTRAEVDNGLALIVIDDEPDVDEVKTVLDVINTLKVELVDKNTGAINRADLKNALDSDAMPSDEAIEAAVSQFMEIKNTA